MLSFASFNIYTACTQYYLFLISPFTCHECACLIVCFVVFMWACYISIIIVVVVVFAKQHISIFFADSAVEKLDRPPTASKVFLGSFFSFVLVS